ncbi:MerR family transcriptional regulator [Panacagrimonas sp.]|uniref:MerR family transcriptional regulator n=1 Tax=Panacagrimonas sp. TaxID=2480088 RepID=UPI003B5262A4
MPTRTKTAVAAGRRKAGSVAHEAREYTIDELAREAQSTVRNVRAYQDRGLLPPPVKRGRTGWYNHEHLSRLRLIGSLLSRGYTLGNIGELLDALERGHDLRQIVGLEQAISSPWSDEVPRHYSLPELLRMFGIVFSPRTLAKVIELGLLEPDGLRYRAPSPKMLIAGAELSKAGMPLDDLLKVIEGLRANVQRVADEMVRLIARLLDRYGEGELPPREDVPKLAETVWRLRPLAMMAVEAEVSRALEKSANKFLGDRIAQILEQMQR